MAFKTVGSRSKYTGTFRDTDGGLFDGAVVLFKIRPAVGDEVTYRYGVDSELVRVSQGVYTCEVTWTVAGDWYIRWQVLAVEDDESTGLASYEKRVQVAATKFTRPILPILP